LIRRKKFFGHTLNNRLTKYAAVGIIATAIHLSAAFAFIYLIDHSIFFSNVFGFSLAFFFSYIAQSKYVFISKLSFRTSFRFFLVQFASLLLAISIVDLTKFLNAYLNVLLVVIILPLITFLIHRAWTFVDHEK
jgi:putative flippase GtrA